ncbi:MAG: MTH1187 family thiamine-binding protein [Candidatus Sumerlaeaceae bacterium]|nr:MTH1187 family thiamine-binding protein [Candidatus Sumerlaeaceae bacterium]
MLAEFSIAPMNHPGGLSGVVAEMIRIVDDSGLPYELHAMGTIIEGPWDEVMAVIGKCHAKALETGSRVSTFIKIDDNPGRTNRLTGKVEAVERVLGRPARRCTPDKE